MGKIPIEDMPKSEWDRFMDTNLTALFLTSQTFIRHCLKEKERRALCQCIEQIGRLYQ